MEKEIKVGIHNKFDFVKRDAKTGEILGEYKAENIILNGFWEKYCSLNNMTILTYIHFGKGTVTPLATDVKLTSWLGYKTTTNLANDYSELFTSGIVKRKVSCRLEDTEFVGESISEVGLSHYNGGTSGLLTKALVKDMNGNVVSITKGAGEVLDIFATFYIMIGNNFQSGDIQWNQPFTTVDSTSSPSLARCLTMNMAWDNNYCDDKFRFVYGKRNLRTHEHPSDKASSKILTPIITYDYPNKKIIFTPPNVVSSEANDCGSGITEIHISGLSIKVPNANFTQPVLTKEVVAIGDGATKDFNTAFGWILNNGTFKLYYNDVEQSGVTVDYGRAIPSKEDFLTSEFNVVSRKQLISSGVVAQMPGIGYSPYIVIPAGTSDFEPYSVVLENPLHATFPVTAFLANKITLYASESLGGTWVKVGETYSQSTISVAAQYQGYRYWKVMPIFSNASNSGLLGATVTGWSTSKIIHAATAPAAGATVAVTYQPDCIAKDAQHVLNNIKVTLTFNEYTPT